MNGKICRGGRTAARLDAASFDEVATTHPALARAEPFVGSPLRFGVSEESVEAAFEKIRDVSWGEATHPRGTAMSVRTASGFMTRLNLTRIHPRSH